MDDGKIVNKKDEKFGTPALASLPLESPLKLTTNGHDFIGEPSNFDDDSYKSDSQSAHIDKPKKRINPLKIHLGKQPSAEHPQSYFNNVKKKLLPHTNKTNNSIKSLASKSSGQGLVPKLIPRKLEKDVLHNVSSKIEKHPAASLQGKGLPRNFLKHHMAPFKRGKHEKGSQLKEYAQYLGLQPTVKFKCRKCCSMSFKSLGMLKEHQRMCRSQAREPALSPEGVGAASEAEGTGPCRVTRKVYLCSACGTYYENWNLFLHMREVHNRHICLFCLGMFSKAEKLASHLVSKHKVKEFSYGNTEEFFSVYSGTLYLMCCVCDEICSEQDDFFNHDCNNVKPKPVPVLVRTANKQKSVKLARKQTTEVSVNGSVSDVIDQQVIAGCKPAPVEDQLTNENKEMLNESIDQQILDIQSSSKDTSASSGNADLSKDSNSTPNSSVEKVLTEPRAELYPIAKPEVINDAFSSVAQEVPHKVTLLENTRLLPSDIVAPMKMNIEPPEVPDETPKNHNNNLTVTKEKDCGIKLKFSLNKAQSPVIINSTVDPAVGKQALAKPPTRVRRPPKRYEKSSSPAPMPPSSPATNIKTTIYDNKTEDLNTLNRVPKLTVRVPKELLDKDSSSDYSSDSNASDKLTVDESSVVENTIQEPEPTEVEPIPAEEDTTAEAETTAEVESAQEAEPPCEPPVPAVEAVPEVTAPVEDVPLTELSLDRPLDKYPLKDLLKVFVAATMSSCIYCNHVRKIAVNCKQLCLHIISQHRFSATVDSITAEELMPETISAKIKLGADDLDLVFINLDCYDSIDKCELNPYDHSYECFQCYFKTTIHKELYFHNRKLHQKTILLCIMCKTNFYSYSELLCHLCPGTYNSEYEMKFRCCLCSVDSIPSAFRLMVHLRKTHHACDVCIESCNNQSRLSNHVWKHKLHHLCYRCGIAYRNKPDITKHLFWKHGTESVLCKRCLQKKWPHVYHFCIPPKTFICEECNLNFTRAVSLKVHKRFHSGDYPHPCLKEECTEKFVSKKLLAKHSEIHTQPESKDPIPEEIKMEIEESVKKEEPSDTNTSSKSAEGVCEDSEGKVVKAESPISKKSKKKKSKDKDNLLLDVNLPALNLSESDSSDESDSGVPQNKIKPEDATELVKVEDEKPDTHTEEKVEPVEDDKPSEQQVLDIWDNFKQYQAKVEKQKSPPLVSIKKHVCESDHDYCLIPNEVNGADGLISPSKRQKKKSPKKRRGGSSSSSSSSSGSDSSCSCGSNCSCSSSSGSSSSSSSDSDSSDSGKEKEKKKKPQKKTLSARRDSCGSHASAVDVMGMEETPILIPEKREPPIAESDLDTEETETDEEFYDEHPQHQANKLYAEKRNQLMLLASVAPSDNGSVTGEVSRCPSPEKEKSSSRKKTKTKKRKKDKSVQKTEPIKINIPKEVIPKSDPEPVIVPPLLPNKITISLHSNTVQIPEMPKFTADASKANQLAMSRESKRASKRRRVPNKFYGYSSDEEFVLKQQQPPKLEWRKEDLPSPTVVHKVKKEEVPLTTIFHKLQSYTEPIIRMATPVPDLVPPPQLMNTESMESSSDSSDEGALEICQPNLSQHSIPIPPPHINAGTSSLPYPFPRPAGFRQAREGESVYCYCRCPYDEVSEMIACDADGCAIEWFHFECVGIMVPPKGKWYCPDCRQKHGPSTLL